jgi:hypothetical protein
MGSSLPPLDTVSNSELLARVNLASSQVIAKVHPDCALELDPTIKDALQEINLLRRGKRDRLGNPLKEHYPYTRYRIISPPRVSHSTMELHLAPIDFAYLALLKDPTTPTSVKAYISKKIDQITAHDPMCIDRSNSLSNLNSPVPLGIEIVIITKDRRTLLRKRGRNVLMESGSWDVAFSGYIGFDSQVGDKIDLGFAIESESRREIGFFPANIEDIVITGLHRNTSSESIDVLGYWRIAATAEQLAELLSENFPGEMKIFETTKRANEPFVWDTSNLIINFNSAIISKTLTQVGVTVQELMPEALASMLLALDSVNRS